MLVRGGVSGAARKSEARKIEEEDGPSYSVRCQRRKKEEGD
jgi:hypothetical protein